MPTEVQVIDQAVDTAFAEDDAKDKEEERGDFWLDALDNLNASLLQGVATKEGIDVVKDMFDTRTDAEKAVDIEKKIYAATEGMKDKQTIVDEEEVPSETVKEIESGSTGTAAEDAEDVAEKVVKVKVQNAPDLSTSDYIQGVNLKSFGNNGEILNQPIHYGMKLAINTLFGWNKKDPK